MLNFNNYLATDSAGIYLFKVNNGNTRKMFEICSKLTIKTPERYWRRSGVFIDNLEQISHIVLVFSLFRFEQVNASVDILY